MWPLYAVASALFITFRKTSEKKLTAKLPHFTIGWIVQLSSVPVLIVALLLFGKIFNPFTLGSHFWLPVIVKWFGFYPLNTYFYLQSLKRGELSKTLPLQSLSPVVTALFGITFLRQIPNSVGILGILLVTIGVYILNIQQGRLHNPLHTFTKDKANAFALASLIMTSAFGVLDSISIKASGALFQTLICTLGAVVVLWAIARFKGEHTAPVTRGEHMSLAGAGTFFGISYAAYSLAIATGPLAYAISVRGGALCISAVLAAFLAKNVLHEQKCLD
jgi:uncharacterized membrane protein